MKQSHSFKPVIKTAKQIRGLDRINVMNYPNEIKLFLAKILFTYTKSTHSGQYNTYEKKSVKFPGRRHTSVEKRIQFAVLYTPQTKINNTKQTIRN